MSSFMPSVKALSKAAITYSQLALLSSSNTVSGGSPETCSNPQTSCQNTSAVANTCCFNAPGGQLLQTQFWDADPSTGPVDSWTIHGLWPDHCDGTYDSNCDPSRAYTNITAILTAAGQTSLLSYMDTYWVSDSGTNEAFWDHEWEKHGTCISTLEPDCYTDYTPQEEVVDFFNKVVTLFKTLPSYTWLSDAGIVPSSTTTYTSADILAALQAPRGVTAVIQCENTRSTPTTAPGTPFSGKGSLQVTFGGQANGCIISAGTWYIGGTCATFTATVSGSGFTLTSSKGKCAVQNADLVCASSVSTATVFTSSGGELAYDDSPSFYASSVPSGSVQATVSTATMAQPLTITWQSS
ncbi:MAG: ribonuclease T2-like [Alectoria sarmentosa]|nr:MAG: ribonuclease T2-like [Alectoria sarmentosa]